MEIQDWVRLYKENLFTPFPLAENSKEPPAGTSLSNIDVAGTWRADSNLALFAGSNNGLVILDADSKKSQDHVEKELKNSGYFDWTTVVRTPGRDGRHYWLRVVDVPKWVQAYYKTSEIGGGELRLKRPAYVLAPPSVIPAGSYSFVQGSPDFFYTQPAMAWADAVALALPGRTLEPPSASPRVFSKDNSEVLKLPYDPIRRDQPTVLFLLDQIAKAGRGKPVCKIDFVTGVVTTQTYPSRSEAEAALVCGLVMSGWTFEEVADLFEQEEPGHYAEVKNKERYLVATWNYAVRMLAATRRG